jgi:hypothetical protein
LKTNLVFYRIERLWRDLRTHVIQYYMTLFHTFESEGMNIDNIRHIFTLQYMFMPRIQSDMDRFRSDWNHHPITTERNRSPIQLLWLRANEAPPESQVPYDYGVEGYFYPHDEGLELEADRHVQCDPLRCPLTPANLAILRNTIDPISINTPLQEFNNLYRAALTLVNHLIDLQ